MANAMISRFMFVSVLGGFLVGAQSAQAGSTMPPGAFLQQPAPDIMTLNRQIQKDPLVAGRYARLYSMSPDMVRMAFSKMRLSTLSEDHVYEVHYVHPGEKIGYKVRRIRKGTAIYRMPDGTPALVRICGNPIRATHTTAVRGAFRRAPEAGQPETALDFQPYEPLESNMTPSPEPAFGPRVGEPYTGFIESPEVAMEIPAVSVGLAPVAAAATAAHAVSSFAGAAPVLGALGALGGLAALASGSGSSGSGSTIPPTGGGSSTPPVIIPSAPGSGSAAVTPEPNAVLLTLALLSSGGVMLLCRRRKANRA
jgi:hypothetical protein